MRGRFANVLLPGGMRPAAVILSIAVSTTTAGSARADRYGPWTEDLLYRPGQGLGDPAGVGTWFFYALAVFVGVWAVLRLRAHVENPQRYGLAQPAVAILVAVGLAAATWGIGDLLRLLLPPPAWRGD